VQWEEFCLDVAERWGKSKHTFYMTQMLVLSQTSIIDEYTTNFVTLLHQILLEDTYTTSEVLSIEIRTAVILHCPKDTETASLLAKF
jgi:hypothetical protein